MKINNCVNEKRNFHGRMSETLHEGGTCFVEDRESRDGRSLKFSIIACMSSELV